MLRDANSPAFDLDGATKRLSSESRLLGMSLGGAVGMLGGIGATKYKIGKMTKAV